MEAKYSAGRPAPEFGVDLELGGRLLPMPTKDDSLPLLARKMEDLEAVVKRHRSLAVATGLMGTAHHTTDPIAAAKQVMSAIELDMYNDWEAGTRLEGWNKETCRVSRDKFKGNEKSLAKWTIGLQSMYEDRDLGPEHVAWIATQRAFLAPCVLAHATVEGLKKGILVPGKELSAEELAEYQTCRKIIAAASYRVGEIKKIVNQQTGKIDLAIKQVQGVQEIYARRMRTTEVGTAPINREREQLGKRKLGAPTNLRDLKRGRPVAGGEVVGDETRKQRRRLGRLAISREGSPEYTPKSPGGEAQGGGDVAMGDIGV